jgi:peptide-methionine (S)-S-oxide reductase
MTAPMNKALALLAVLTLAGAWACAQDNRQDSADPAASRGLKVATFAGGCFWCMEPPFDKLPGVRSTISGYIGGQVENPTYEQVSAGRTGHTEAVQVTYDPAQVDYATLLEVFWKNIDPLAVNHQFCDYGSQYRSAIFPHDEEQQRLAEASMRRIAQRFEEPIATKIEATAPFYPAEDYHQDYYKKNPVRYNLYRWNCGRDERLEELWGESPH